MEIFKTRLKGLIAIARDERGLTQKSLAKSMDLSHERLNKWLTTLVEPRLEHVVQLARILDTHPNYLLGEDDNPVPPKDRDVNHKLDQILKKINLSDG